MSIARTAPEKFDFQDLVCAELALRFLPNSTLKLLIEPYGGEDARLTAAREMGVTTIDVQTKDEATPMTVRRIAECLAHFPPRQAADCLLERLIADASRVVLIVTSGRCDDAASTYVVKPDWAGQAHADRSIRQVDAVRLLGELAKVDPAGSRNGELFRRRKRHCRALAETIAPEVLRSACQRLLVLERLTVVELERNCSAYLHRYSRIPVDRLTHVIARLHSAIKISKKKGSDAIPLVRSVMEENAPFSLRPMDYVERGEESKLADLLSAKSVLLLSGRPRCGKSETARHVASQFEVIGYATRDGVDVDEASRYLLDPGGGDRLYVLHDPLGGVHAAPDVDRVLERLRGLVGRIGAARKLIVAQGQDELFATTRVNDLCKCSVTGHTWIDLSSPSSDFLVRAWDLIAARARVGEPGRTQLRDALASGNVRLDVGALRHIALSNDQLPPTPTLQQLLAKAAEDAAALGRALANQSRAMEELLVALAIGCDTDTPISFVELGFITSRDNGTLPGREENRSVGGGKISSFPLYAITPAIRHKIEIGLEMLERRGFVWVRDDRTVFTHPFYRSAAETVLREPTARTADVALTYLERGLFSLAATTSRSAARSLGLLGTAVKNSSRMTLRLLEIAVDGLQHSIFPGTRDACLNFLLSWVARAPTSYQEQLAGWVRSIRSIGLESVEWRDGEAWLPSQLPFGRFASRQLSSAEQAEAESDIAVLSRKDTHLISSQRAAQVLKFLLAQPELMSSETATRLLSYDEAMIRAETARIWLMRPRSRDSEIRRRIFEDLHPSVALGALEAILEAWADNATARNTVLLRGLASAGTRPAVSIALLDTLGKFDRVEVTGEKPPWRVFGYLLPGVLRALPASVHVHDDHLYSATRSAIKRLDAKDIAAISSEWIGWLEREIESRLPTDYELGVAEIVIEGVESASPVRLKLVRRLLGLPSTGALVSIVRDFVPLWHRLSTEERGAVLEILTAKRPDSRWLAAVAITRARVPDEIQRIVLGRSHMLDDPPESLVDELPGDLLAAAVAVYCGRPQPLWYLGTHHPPDSKIGPVIHLIEQRPTHPLFGIAFDEALRAQKDDRVAEIVSRAGAAHAERLFELLIRQKVAWSGNWLPKTWKALLNLAADPRVLDDWIHRLVEAAPTILDDLSDLARWLQEPRHYYAVLEHLKGDCAAVLLVNALSRTPQRERNPQFVKGTLALIQNLLNVNPPQLHGTYSYIRDVLSALKIGIQPLESDLRNGREVALRGARDAKDLFRETETPPADWLGRS